MSRLGAASCSRSVARATQRSHMDIGATCHGLVLTGKDASCSAQSQVQVRLNTRAARLASRCWQGKPPSGSPGRRRCPRPIAEGQTKRPAGPGGTQGGRASGATERGLEFRGVDASSRQLGRMPQAARRVRNRRPTPEARNSEAFAETRSSPRQLRHKLAAIIDRLAFLMN